MLAVKEREMTVRTRLSEIMQERQITRRELSLKTRIDERTLQRWEENRINRADFPTIDKLCEALDCEPGDLIVRD